MMKKVAAGSLILLAAVMIFLGVRAGIEAPVVTGLGFLVIAAVFWADSARA
jgi:hypothetical protein